MKKQLIVLLIVIISGAFLAACAKSSESNGYDNSEDVNINDPYVEDDDFKVNFYRKVARYVGDDGWVFTFVRNGDKSGDDSEIYKYQFFGINIRYKYDDAYVQKTTHTTDFGTPVTETVVPGILIWGTGPAEQGRDFQVIDSILNNDRSDEELLGLDADDYTFEALDKDMFFDLMRTALTGEPQREGTSSLYWNKPMYGFYMEPDYIDGYRFQIAFLQATGLVDELYIDVQYRTGNGYKDYVQLSDMVDAGTATEEQKAVFEKIQAIVSEIKEKDSFIAGADGYRAETVGDIDFARLYTFLNNIHENKFDLYDEEPIILSTTEGSGEQ